MGKIPRLPGYGNAKRARGTAFQVLQLPGARRWDVQALRVHYFRQSHADNRTMPKKIVVAREVPRRNC